MIFVDTGAWFAANFPPDTDHNQAIHWLEQNREPLLTTDYVVDELLTLLRARGARERAITAAEQFFLTPPGEVHAVSREECFAAFEVFRHFSDKDWSFTDCLSYVIIKQYSITVAFAFDDHFRQFGSVTVVPQRRTKKPKRSR